MHRVIDTPWSVTAHFAALRAGGADTVIRYYNHRNSGRLPQKRIEKAEADAIAGEGLSLAVIFQQRGGAGDRETPEGHIEDFGEANGRSDARRAAEIAGRIGQPEGSAIYFAVDHDFFQASDLAAISNYFAAASAELDGKFRIGVYGSGTVGRAVREAGHADLIWLAMSSGWSGTREMLSTDTWALLQKFPPIETPLPHDGNTVSPAWADFGQFVPGAAPRDPSMPQPAPANTVLMQIMARGGLNLRRGPGTDFAVERTLPPGMILHALARHGVWVQVDLEGDALADGYVHGDFLAPVSGGFPVVAPTPPTSLTPPTPPTPPTMRAGGLISSYDIARAELALDVREVPGSGNNPRIVMYHNTTASWSGTDDAVAWCSSFVNYCVEQTGRVGTRSQRALDWEGWGQDTGDAPAEGDITVFERVGEGGHVAFLVEDLGDHVSVLGGNQSNRVRISTYPKDGRLGGTHYRLRSIRRG